MTPHNPTITHWSLMEMLTNGIDVAPVGLGLGMDLRIPVHLEEKKKEN